MREAFFRLNHETLGWYYILQVDLEYPPELHDRDDYFPMAPGLMDITPEMLSDRSHSLLVKYFHANAPGSKKLICSLLTKKNYVVFGQLLEHYL